jgi:hypothetical protein
MHVRKQAMMLFSSNTFKPPIFACQTKSANPRLILRRGAVVNTWTDVNPLLIPKRRAVVNMPSPLNYQLSQVQILVFSMLSSFLSSSCL